MELHVIGTGSEGNCYILGNEDEQLLIECGVRMDDIKKAFNFDFSKLSGCILTHEHGDHNKSLKEVMKEGIDVYASAGTFKGSGITENKHRCKIIESKKIFSVGNFRILPFDVKHDVNEPLGFVIEHKSCGKVLFLTDTNYCKFKIPGLNNIIIEANFSKKIIKETFGENAKNEYLKNRILRNHFSIEDCMDMLEANDLSKVNNIVLIHLSDRNSHEKLFQQQVYDLTAKNVYCANNGDKYNFSTTPF